MHVWSHPIDLEFKVESIDGWYIVIFDFVFKYYF